MDKETTTAEEKLEALKKLIISTNALFDLAVLLADNKNAPEVQMVVKFIDLNKHYLEIIDAD